jgi:hypothetical protein
MLNSRMKDFFDLWVLARHSDFDGPILSRAVAATFDRRRTSIPHGAPIGLSDKFINDVQKNRQWQAFLRKNALDPMPLARVIVDLREFLLPVLASVEVCKMQQPRLKDQRSGRCHALFRACEACAALVRDLV